MARQENQTQKMVNVLLTNDDGPLNDDYSPYIRPFVSNLLKYHPDWNLTIVTPHIQRSWNSKAHLAGHDCHLSVIYVDLSKHDNKSFYGPFATKLNQISKKQHDVPENCIEWLLIDGTPASCTNIALHHLKPINQSTGQMEDFDLVISGPNVGRNTSAAYITSSATVGAAMEAVITSDIKSIALSWAYFNGTKYVNNEGGILDLASKLSLNLIDQLYNHDWDKNVDLYSINVPLLQSLSVNDTKAILAPIWENRWGCMYNKPETIMIKHDSKLMEIEDGSEIKDEQLIFKWNPNFQSHYDSKHGSNPNQPQHDMDVVESGNIAVTPLRALFQSVQNDITKFGKEIKFQRTAIDEETLIKQNYNVVLSISPKEYIFQPLRKAFINQLPNVQIFSNLNDQGLSNDKQLTIFHYGDYEQLDMDRLSMDHKHYFTNSYIYRKALIRKHYLSHTIHNYIVKHPESILNQAYLESYTLDLDYAEFLDDSLDENWELRQELETSKQNEKWWIVKPSMSDKGQGIRVFQTIDQLQEIFDSFDDEPDEELSSDINQQTLIDNDNKIIISQLRHFIVQEYLSNPLLLSSMNNKKFHIRCYITCMGDMNVFVYNRMLALFASVPFIPLTNDNDNDYNPIDLNILQAHLTNTCLQTNNKDKDLSVMEFDKLIDINDSNKLKIKSQIYDIAHDIFLAAKSVNSLNFQPLSNAMETFGVDFLVDDQFNVKLLEINAYPDFKQTGDDLKTLIDELFDNVTKYCIKPLLDGRSKNTDIKSSESFKNVLNYTSNDW